MQEKVLVDKEIITDVTRNSRKFLVNHYMGQTGVNEDVLQSHQLKEDPVDIVKKYLRIISSTLSDHKTDPKFIHDSSLVEQYNELARTIQENLTVADQFIRSKNPRDTSSLSQTSNEINGYLQVINQALKQEDQPIMLHSVNEILEEAAKERQAKADADAQKLNEEAEQRRKEEIARLVPQLKDLINQIALSWQSELNTYSHELSDNNPLVKLIQEGRQQAEDIFKKGVQTLPEKEQNDLNNMYQEAVEDKKSKASEVAKLLPKVKPLMDILKDIEELRKQKDMLRLQLIKPTPEILAQLEQTTASLQQKEIACFNATQNIDFSEIIQLETAGVIQIKEEELAILKELYETKDAQIPQTSIQDKSVKTKELREKLDSFFRGAASEVNKTEVARNEAPSPRKN